MKCAACRKMSKKYGMETKCDKHMISVVEPGKLIIKPKAKPVQPTAMELLISGIGLGPLNHTADAVSYWSPEWTPPAHPKTLEEFAFPKRDRALETISRRFTDAMDRDPCSCACGWSSK